METIETVIFMMTPGCFMASIDLKDAYYCAPIEKENQKCLTSFWNYCIYQFTCYPNRLACHPRKFTKLLKPVYYTLRQAGHLSGGYIEGTYPQGKGYDECLENVEDTVTLCNKLGLLIHPDKSVLYPTQQIVFLG